jgi:ubiquinone/menaquinone biosynthesis C-methylase UbiE
MPLSTPSALELKTIRALADFSGRRVLEIGAGDGRLSWPFMPEAAQWVALDPDVGEIAAARRERERDKEKEKVRLVIGDGRAVCFPAECFDLALFTWSLC